MVNGTIIEFEGIDRCGKDSLASAVHKLTNFRYNLRARGMISQLVYNDKFARGINYKFDYTPVIVYLTISPEEYWNRCVATNESIMDTSIDRELFDKYINEAKQKGIPVLEYDTSNRLPEDIAKDLIIKLKELIDN